MASNTNAVLQRDNVLMDDICTGCEFKYFRAICTFMDSDENAAAFLQKHHVLPQQIVCPRCGHNCKLRSDKPLWVCKGGGVWGALAPQFFVVFWWFYGSIIALNAMVAFFNVGNVCFSVT